MPKIFACRNVEVEGLGNFAPLLDACPYDWQYVCLPRGEAIPPVEEIAGLIVLGGPMNVYEEDRYPYLRPETDLIAACIERDIPVLGICLGAQLIAKALGAKVRAGARKEIGWYPLQLAPAAQTDTCFADFPAEPTVFQWHGDTFELPTGATALASSELFPYQGFRVGNSAYALQFHLEIRRADIAAWLAKYAGEAEQERQRTNIPNIDTDTELHYQALAALSESFFRRWLSLVA